MSRENKSRYQESRFCKQLIVLNLRGFLLFHTILFLEGNPDEVRRAAVAAAEDRLREAGRDGLTPLGGT